MDGMARLVPSNTDDASGRVFTDGDNGVISRAEAGDITFGSDLVNAFLMRDDASGAVYLVYLDAAEYSGSPPLVSFGAVKRWISSPEAMDRYHFDWGKVVHTGQGWSANWKNVGQRLNHAVWNMLMGLPVASPATLDAAPSFARMNSRFEEHRPNEKR
jgi:hypothetical protein